MVIDKKNDNIIGSTRFNPVPESENAIEIGWSYLAQTYWGGIYNKSQKFLLMDYAFQHVDNILFYINKHNTRSRKAVEKLGGRVIIQLDNRILDGRGDATVIYCIYKEILKR